MVNSQLIVEKMHKNSIIVNTLTLNIYLKTLLLTVLNEILLWKKKAIKEIVFSVTCIDGVNFSLF